MVSPPRSVERSASMLAPKTWNLLGFALVFGGAALYVPDPLFAIVFLALAATMAGLFILLRLIPRVKLGGPSNALKLVSSFAGKDVTPSFVTDSLGQLTYRNAAAKERFGSDLAETLVRAMGELFANPAAVIHRLQSRAETEGGAREDVVTRNGHVRISVQEIAKNAFFWRFDEMKERGGGRGAETLSLPLITVGRGQTILFMNEAARRILGGRAKSIEHIFPEKLPSDGIVEIIGAEGPMPVRVICIAGGNGRHEIYFVPAQQPEPVPSQNDLDLDTLPVALLRLSTKGEVLQSNALARGLLKASENVTDLSELVEGPGRAITDWVSDAARSRAANRSEVVRLRDDTQEVFLQISVQRVQVDDRVEVVAVLQDATELKTLEAQFVQGQKMQAIGQLAGGIAHDFNNLLTAISGHCDLLLLRHDQTDPEYADLMQVSQNATRAASLVGQLLAFSRKQTLRPEVVDMRETVSDLSHLLNRLVGERVHLTVNNDPNLAPIRADKRQLEQVVMNLVVNARDAMPEGGEVRIETAMHFLEEDLKRDRALVPAGDYVLVRVIDEGHGIPEDKRAKIFEPFFTTKNVGEGTGLGLSMAYGIVKQTGGFIFVDSAVGAGTCFTLYFPADDAVVTDQPMQTSEPMLNQLPFVPTAPAIDASQAADDDANAVGTEGVVLLVEDEGPVRAFASRALRMRGFTVLEAGNAEEALATLEDDDVSVDVFVTDVIMPGMDGPSWVRQALEKRPDTRVVFVSGYAEDTFPEAQRRIPNSVFLPKPFSLAQLTSTVHGQLH
ncbi:histidine kinase [Actibacterium mucosum KCTC 23349]|uniref:histidine kinase n=1 Tax=Actibacterium mucosum KCTC 23349 TaxID=1454373 RepID=A0A037ZIH3_9RHOB|nr:histidine kinase [Actibacterium mucosum KCTC 23349]